MDSTDKDAALELSADELDDVWAILTRDERLDGFRLLDAEDAEDFFQGLSARDQAELALSLTQAERRPLIRVLDPDDAADLIQEADAGEREEILSLLDAPSRRQVRALLAYEEDEAGGLMSPRFARMRAEMTIDEAIAYLRRQARTRLETMYYAYALDDDQRLLGVVSFRQLFTAQPNQRVSDVMETDVVSVPDEMDQETVSRVLSEADLLAVPVLDENGRMQGIITVDDIVDVVQEEATEDIQKAGGMQALDAPYLQTSLGEMVLKRAPWLVVLFIGGTFTASAMGRYEDAIERLAFLSLFVPLMISSGGNSGSQASTLVIRAIALDEVRLRDWWRVMRRELAAGLILGLILGAIGFGRILAEHRFTGAYGGDYLRFGLTVGISLVAIVLWGSTTGSMLPLLLRRMGLDPASASAPFVATLVDVTGILIYFNVATWLLAAAMGAH